MVVKVLHKKWKIIVRSDEFHSKRFDAVYGKCHAVTIIEDRKIHVRKSSLNKETIIHELIHAWQHELSFHELQLDDDQVEEWYCELFGKYGRMILDDVDRLLKQYKKK